jgi:hypothetical protein
MQFSIQFSKSLNPVSGYLVWGCRGDLSSSATRPIRHPRHQPWERYDTEAPGACQPLSRYFSSPCRCFFPWETEVRRSPCSCRRRREADARPAVRPGGRARKKNGGRVPRQGRHVLAGTLDRMEGASLRGPETLPPKTRPYKLGDAVRHHREGAGSLSTLLPQCDPDLIVKQPPSSGDFHGLIERSS